MSKEMQALTKAIKARVAVRDASGTGVSGKLVPSIEWDTTGRAYEANMNFTIGYTVTSDASSCLAWYVDFGGTLNRGRDMTYSASLSGTISGTTGRTSDRADLKIVVEVPETNNYEAGVFLYNMEYVD